VFEREKQRGGEREREREGREGTSLIRNLRTPYIPKTAKTLQFDAPLLLEDRVHRGTSLIKRSPPH
jgi:hypothetical protein